MHVTLKMWAQQMVDMKALARSFWQLRVMGREIDPYPVMRPFMFRLDPEAAHTATVKMLREGYGPHEATTDDPILASTLWGQNFANPVGLAAGFDKQAEVIDEVFQFGFGFSEIGGVTRQPQAGNPQPRVFRAVEAKAIINRYGFNSIGIEEFTTRVKNWREKPSRTLRPLGVNLGKNKESREEAADFIAMMVALAPYVDFVTINISSPNTPGLRDLQKRDYLDHLLDQLQTARRNLLPDLTMLVKIAPDLDDRAQQDIAELCLKHQVQGLIVGNTTLTRSSNIPRVLAEQAGGLSGRPLLGASTKILGNFYRLTGGKIPLIGVGGIFSGGDAYQKIRAGASLVQLYSALVYEGPLVVRRIKRDLAALLKRDGFASLKEAVGADHNSKI